MAICDANYCFSFVSVGSYGRDNDASIFNQTEFGRKFKNGEYDLPQASHVGQHHVPYVLLADDIFPLSNWLMKPYRPCRGGVLSERERVFNYRLSRARRTIENAFGLLRARWRIFKGPIKAHPVTVDSVVKAAVCLHNYLMQVDTSRYCPHRFIDSEDGTGAVIPGSWRSQVTADDNLQNIRGRAATGNHTADPKLIREKFTNVFNSDYGSLPWQLTHIRSTGHRLN